MEKWIPVTERLPEANEHKEVWAINAHGDHMVWQNTTFSKASAFDITHWQPLPDPPKGE